MHRRTAYYLRQHEARQADINARIKEEIKQAQGTPAPLTFQRSVAVGLFGFPR
jgi:hypothetical protein